MAKKIDVKALVGLEPKSKKKNITVTGKGSGRELLLAQGGQEGFDIPSLNRARLVVFGLPGTGKTCLAAGNPQGIIIDTERGAGSAGVVDDDDKVLAPRAVRFCPPENMMPSDTPDWIEEKVEGVLRLRRAGKLPGDWTIIIDTWDRLIDTYQDELCHEYGVEEMGDTKQRGGGYAIVRHRIFHQLDQLHAAGFGYCILAHTTARLIDGEGGAQHLSLGAACSESFKRALFAACEHMLFIERGEEIIEQPPQKKKIKGQFVEIPQPAERRACRWLLAKPGGLWKKGETDEIKVRVPMPEKIILPNNRYGWDVLGEAYDEAVNLLESSLTKEKSNG